MPAKTYTFYQRLNSRPSRNTCAHSACDIRKSHEPTDAQLDALMKSVAEEVARRNCGGDYISSLRVYDWIIGILFPPEKLTLGKVL